MQTSNPAISLVASHSLCYYSCQVSCFFASETTMSMLDPWLHSELCCHSSASCSTSAYSVRSLSDFCFEWSLGHFRSSFRILAARSSDLKTSRCSVPSPHFTVLSSHWTCFSTCFECSTDSYCCYSAVAAVESMRSAVAVSSLPVAKADSISPQRVHYLAEASLAASVS